VLPAMLKTDLHARSALCGGLRYVSRGALGMPDRPRVAVTILATLVLRALAMRYALRLPRVASLRASPSELTRERRGRK